MVKKLYQLQLIEPKNYIGKSPWDSILFNGKIGNLQIYNRALSPQEVEVLKSYSEINLIQLNTDAIVPTEEQKKAMEYCGINLEELNIVRNKPEEVFEMLVIAAYAYNKMQSKEFSLIKGFCVDVLNVISKLTMHDGPK